MALDPAVFEKLGAFYLGRPHDLAAKKSTNDPLLYDSRDLTTHAVCVGMTGSGKTGLCLALLEEAAMDGVPAILIDPKGDLGNLLLTFPDLRAEDFRPWINEEDARRKGMEPDAYATGQAETWRDGLARWGQTPDRIRALREKVDMAIYTPGSSSGLPVNVLASFDAPKTKDPEVVADRVQTAAASLLGLLKLDADPVKSRECILLSAIFSHEWALGNDLQFATLIEKIQHPPFEKIGVLDLETFYPAKDRFQLVLALNNVLASPGFASWQQGEALDAGKFLFTSEGKPRLSIFSIAHLSDDERMFFVSLLLNEILSWTRSQSGTTSLRAIVYMDEIFGYLPPTANPPSKLPMLTMLKQARAFGVGMVLATQNPVDLDYKALSNCGTWFIGRLQTERDKARMLDGLQGAAAGGKFDRQAMENALAGLGSRIFLMNNVHDDGPVVFETRWVMSYLRGPLTRDQIRTLMKDRERPVEAIPVSTPVTSVKTGATSGRPALPPDVPQVFLPGPASSSLEYAPVLLGMASVRFSDRSLGIKETREVILLTAIPDGVSGADWDGAEALELPQDALEQSPRDGVGFQEVGDAASRAKNYVEWKKDFQEAVRDGQKLTVFQCAELKETSRPGESEADFRARIALAARERRDDAVAELRKKFAPKIASLQARMTRAKEKVEQQKLQASHARMQTVISVGSAILGALFGRKALSSTTVGKAATAARGVSRSMKEGSDVNAAENSVEAIQSQIEDLESEAETECAAMAATEPEVKTVEISPLKTGVNVRLVALAWRPV